MPNSLTIATEGLLQEVGANGCVKVVARESEKTTVTPTVNNTTTVQAPSATVVVARAANAVTVNRTPAQVVAVERSNTQNTVTQINTGLPGADGQDGADGAPGANGVDGIDGESDKNYRHVQTNPEATWVIVHGLNKYPAVTVVDSGGTEVVGDIVYISSSTITVNFNAAFSGEVFCN